MFWTDRVRRRAARAVDPALVDRPIIGGLRHRIPMAVPPADNAMMTLLCGFEHSEEANRPSPHIYDCHACEDVHREHQDGPQ
ncbi:hypothetical protein SAMN05216266_11344 [Amycolatopsis marina]|uniref:DUF3039 domain-containing protein n=1 Tax=Amycolatopsis marina TaxID=490629 RepID=A0A1I1BDG7_9PSEU|nr:hypothetical protein SAMN05216266_11344 [Amycolatopsis marina]